MFKIALGAGHGINTPGKRIPAALDPAETREWQLNDRIGDYTELYLSDYDGYELLRLDDSDDGEVDIALAARAKKANDWGADFYLSLHHNATEKIFSGGGITAYCHPQASKASFEWRDELYDALIEETGLSGNRSNPKTTANFKILRLTDAPAVLLELGFMTSTVDSEIILTDEYARACARAIVKVIVRKAGLTEKPKKEEYMTYTEINGLRVAAIPVSNFRVVYYDAPKKSMGENRCTGGFFGWYPTEKFTFPAGHLVADYEAKSDVTRFYCGEWGRFQGGKFILDSAGHEYMNQFHGKSVTTLMVAGGKAVVNDVTNLPPGCDYAISGVPIIRHGEDVKYYDYVVPQGWDGSEVRASWHVFLGIKEASADTIYAVAMRTYTKNLIYSAEAYKKLKSLGFVDVIKLDGGGSFYWNAGGKTKATLENRRICTIIDMGKSSANPYPVPTKALKKGGTGDGVRWMQWELTRHGFACETDGSFGPNTDKQLRAFQAATGLKPDGSCGPATRAELLK